MSGKAPQFTAESGEIARLISYGVLFALSAVMFVEAAGIPVSRFESLGAGAFPMMVHGCLMALLAGAMIGSVRRIPRVAYPAFGSAVRLWIVERRLVIGVFAGLAVYLAAVPVVGFSIATFAFLLVIQFVLGPKTRKAIAIGVALSVIFSFGLNWLFAEVFNVFLPRGR